MVRRISQSKVDLPDRGRVKELYQAQRPALEEALLGFQRRVRALLEKHGHAPTIKFRVKRFDTYYEKLIRLLRHRHSGGPALLSDLLGLRIICPFLEDIDTLERLLTEELPVIEVERKGDGTPSASSATIRCICWCASTCAP